MQQQSDMPRGEDNRVPLTAACIGLCFFVAGAVATFVMVSAHRMNADVRTWRYPIEVAGFVLGALLLGVSGGCMIGVFTYRLGVRKENPTHLD